MSDVRLDLEVCAVASDGDVFRYILKLKLPEVATKYRSAPTNGWINVANNEFKS